MVDITILHWLRMAEHASWHAVVLGSPPTWKTNNAYGQKPNDSVSFGFRSFPEYQLTQSSYISDIGAHEMQPLFISMGAITTVSFQLVYCLERWLRHTGRLLKHKSKLESWLSILAFIAAFVGMIGLIFVSIFDEVRYPAGHNTTLTLFMYVLFALHERQY